MFWSLKFKVYRIYSKSFLKMFGFNVLINSNVFLNIEKNLNWMASV